MAQKTWQVNLNLNQNELLNAVIQNLGANPASGKEGQMWFNTNDHYLYIWANGAATKVGYLPPATTSTLGGVIVGSNLQVAADGTLSIYDASTDHKGVIEIATDAEATTGTSETLAVNPKQLATKVTANAAITGATHTKITYDSKGLVTAGADITLSDVTDVTTTYTELNQLHEAGAVKADFEKLAAVTASASELNTLDGITADVNELNVLDGITATTAELNILDGVTADASEINVLDGITATTTELNQLAGSNISQADLQKLHDITADASEINVLDGADVTTADLTKLGDVTATAAELNVLDGITATTAELNILDGVTADASELNILDGATLTTTELNYVDGVTSSIQDQLDGKVAKNADITASATGKTVITYDAKGLVTGGSEIGIKSGSTNYLEFDTTNHEIGAKVDTTVTANSTNLVTSGAVDTAIANALVGGVIYKGTWDITSATDFSGITLPVKKGYLYYVTGTGPKTIGGIEWNAGDYLMINKDVAAGGTITSADVEKVDNTESSDIVRLNATQTLTNKTIDADDNTISDLELDNFKSGVVQTSVRNSSTATDTTLATEKAVRTELDTKQDRDTDAVQNNIAKFDNNGTTVDSGKAFTTTVSAAGSTSDDLIPTEAAVRTAINSAITGTKFTATNPALTVSGGVCTWNITNTLGDADVQCVVKEVSTGEEVEVSTTYGASTITVKMNSDADISAGAYKAVIMG